jgi:hypothetical protein
LTPLTKDSSLLVMPSTNTEQPAASAALPSAARRNAARVLDAGGTTNEALASAGLTKRKLEHGGFEYLLADRVVFTGNAWSVSCWLLGVDPRDALAQVAA